MMHKWGSIRFVFIAVGLLIFAKSADAGVKNLTELPSRAVSQLETAVADLGRFGVLGAVLKLEGDALKPTTIAYGHADLERKIPMDAERTFLVGSQTKMFTAAAIIKLAQAGKLDLDQSVSTYIPEFREGAHITIRHLLLHQSGIGDGSSLLAPPHLMPRITMDFANLLMISRIVGQEFKPGERYSYNNSGYSILGQVIERASGISRASFIRQHILAPLGMTATYIGGQEKWPHDQMARGYEWNKLCECAQATHNPPDLSWASAAGDMISNAEDLMIWLRALGDPTNPTGLTLADLMTETLAINEPGAMNRYGLGLAGQVAGGLQVWGHGGSINGYFSVSLIEPQSGIRATILLNLVGDKMSSEVYSGTVRAMLDIMTVALTWGVAETGR